MKITILFILAPILLFGQVQIGEDINGETAFDIFGWSVSASSDGTIVAIAAPSSSGTDNYVSIYENVNDVWTQIGNNIEGSGTNVSLSDDGNTVAIGSRGASNPRGHVRVYENVGGVWTQIGDDIDGEGAEDLSGTSVSLSGDATTVAIGAPENGGNGFKSGHVRVYENVGGVWTQIGSDIDGEAANDESGSSVTISSDGSIVAIGARFNVNGDNFSGHVRVYENVGGVWTQIGDDINGEATGNQFGISVSLSDDGTILAIGADGHNSFTGQVRIYENVDGVWTQIGDDIIGEAELDQSGFSVSISSDGSIVAIGAIGNDANGSVSGHVRIYENVGGVWTQIGSDIDGEAAGDQFGRSVSISGNGDTVVIGAPFNNGNGQASGRARVYDLSEILSVNNISLENTIVVYPNPSSENITIQLHENVSLEKAIIYNNLGQIVKVDTTTSIDISSLNIGSYFLKITTNQGVLTKKIIIE